MPPVTRYLNTDLDLISPSDLAPIAAHLQANGLFPLHIERREDGLFYATFETEAEHGEPEATIAAMLRAIESLPDPPKQNWSSLTLREFNIGYECGEEPWAFGQALSPDTLHRIANAGLSLRVTA